MSSVERASSAKPLIVLIDRANRAMQHHMAATSAKRGAVTEGKTSYNAVFGRLPVEGARASDLASRAGVTRQSMGEVIREMVELGLLEMRPDPSDKRAKLVTYTEHGLAEARRGFAYIINLERRFTQEFGDEAYGFARDVLERLVPLLAEIEHEQTH